MLHHHVTLLKQYKYKLSLCIICVYQSLVRESFRNEISYVGKKDQFHFNGGFHNSI